MLKIALTALSTLVLVSAAQAQGLQIGTPRGTYVANVNQKANSPAVQWCDRNGGTVEIIESTCGPKVNGIRKGCQAGCFKGGQQISPQ